MTFPADLPGDTSASDASRGCPMVEVDPAQYPDHAFPPFLERLLAGGPVRRISIPGDLDAWAVTRYADARAALRDPRLIKDPLRLANPGHGLGRGRHLEDGIAVVGRHMLNTDGPDHVRLRATVTAALSASAGPPWATSVGVEIQRLLATLADRAQFDLVDDFARPLQLFYLSTLLGLPLTQTNDLLTSVTWLSGPYDPQSAVVRGAHRHFGSTVSRLLDERRAGEESDLLTHISRVHRQGSISRREAIGVVSAVMIGAGATTVTALSYGTFLALRSAGLRHELLAGHARTQAAVEEILRFHTPVPFTTWRFAREPLQIADTPIPQGDIVLICLATASRDPLVFDPPDALRAPRPTSPAILSFGHGPHHCSGAAPARLLLRIAIPALLARFPQLRLTAPDTPVRWNDALLDRRPLAIHVTPGQPSDAAGGADDRPTA
ncbi:cytochrome P450 [Streptomyces sp. NPDC051546]|uniref:cytochrome P450 n=1 Tax=Streptomyces sp. NPDC051546 TaxID=3365655 RepID=UPI0037B3E508